MSKTTNEFFIQLDQIVDFEKKFQFLPDKEFVGEKYKRHFYFRKRGKSGDIEVYGRTRTLKKYKILKVRITPIVEKFSYPMILFTAGIIGTILISIIQREIRVLIFLIFLLGLILINFLILRFRLKSMSEKVKAIFKKRA
ncbi:hypothetical protein [Sporocytophaga myxococcoides]|nr:hypothetical protein [Sporocytophaga myxococcoides]